MKNGFQLPPVQIFSNTNLTLPWTRKDHNTVVVCRHPNSTLLPDAVILPTTGLVGRKNSHIIATNTIVKLSQKKSELHLDLNRFSRVKKYCNYSKHYCKAPCKENKRKFSFQMRVETPMLRFGEGGGHK